MGLIQFQVQSPLLTSQLQRTVPCSEVTPVFLTSAKKLSRWLRVFLSLSKLDWDLLIHMLGADPVRLSSALCHHQQIYFLFRILLSSHEKSESREMIERNKCITVSSGFPSRTIYFVFIVGIRDLYEIIFLVSPPSNKKLDAAFSTRKKLFSDWKIWIGISFILSYINFPFQMDSLSKK